MVRTGGGMFRPRRGAFPQPGRELRRRGGPSPLFRGTVPGTGRAPPSLRRNAPDAGGMFRRFWGMFRPFGWNIRLFWGMFRPFRWNVRPIGGMLRPFGWTVRLFWGVFRLFRWDIRPIGGTFPR